MHGRQKLTSREKIIWTLAITTIVVLSLSASNPATVEQLSGNRMQHPMEHKDRRRYLHSMEHTWLGNTKGSLHQNC